jgi:hypothetical protein
MRTFIAALAISAMSFGTAHAQEARTVGPGRVEFGVFPVGGLFFGHYTGNSPNFGDYALGTGLTVNLNRRIAVEGEFGGGVGRRQEMQHNGIVLSNQQSPSMVAYNGNGHCESPWQ